MPDPLDKTSWRDALRVEVIHEFLSRIVRESDTAELEMAHVVICHDPETGSTTYSGPFQDAVTALVYAEHEASVDAALNPGPALEFSVSALYPAEQADAT